MHCHLPAASVFTNENVRKWSSPVRKSIKQRHPTAAHLQPDATKPELNLVTAVFKQHYHSVYDAQCSSVSVTAANQLIHQSYEYRSCYGSKLPNQHFLYSVCFQATCITTCSISLIFKNRVPDTPSDLCKISIKNLTPDKLWKKNILCMFHTASTGNPELTDTNF